MSPESKSVRDILYAAEDDVRSVPELLAAIGAIGSHAHASGRGLEPGECRGLYRVAGEAETIAARVVAMWEQVFSAVNEGACAAPPAEPLDRTDVADTIDETRRLVEAAEMAASDFGPDPRAAALCTLLSVIDDKLSALSELVMPGGGA